MQRRTRNHQPIGRRTGRHSARSSHRRGGKILVFLAVLLPTLVGFVGLVIDGGMLMSDHRNLQHVADAAATAAARALHNGASTAQAIADAEDYVQVHNGYADATVTVNIPPSSGAYAGNSQYAEVSIEHESDTFLVHVLGGDSRQSVSTRAVAGYEDATEGAAVVVLDPDPAGVTVAVPPIVSLTLPPVHLGGIEVLGLGSLKVDGAVLVNTEWGGVDENEQPAGNSGGPPYAVSCTPILPLTRLKARDIYVVGGVDDPDHYGHFVSGEASPLQANKLPTPDPYRDLPVPTLSADAFNVSATEYGGRTIIGLPLLGPTITLNPGVYEWIDVVSGKVRFNPGVYIIRGVNPITQISLSVVAGQVTAEGVMFYITDNDSYTPLLGSPDNSDGETEPSGPVVTSLVPSVVLQSSLLGSRFTPLDDSGSPFDGMLIYQRRTDRRPIVVVGQQLLGSSDLAGTVYAKWGQIIFAANGTYDMRLVAGTIRFADVINCTLAPSDLLPAAQDVYLVE